MCEPTHSIVQFPMRVDHVTRLAQAMELDGFGITGAAAEALLKETAPQRHAYRVLAAMEAAKNYVAYRGVDVDEDGWQGMAATVLIADTFGVGGKQGVDGSGTVRHQGLRGLGSGRKHPMDGPAYDAAIRDAVPRLLGVKDHCLTINGWAIECNFQCTGSEPVQNAEPILSLTRTVDGAYLGGSTFDLVDPEWQLTIAREGLRRAAGIGQWFEQPILQMRGPVAAWAAMVNRLSACVGADGS